MKRIVSMLLCVLLAVTFSGCAKKAAVKNTIEGNMKTYYEMTDGTWMCDDHAYKYRLEINGRMPNAAVDSSFVYLSNVEEITFDQAYKAAGLSSDSDDYFSPEKAVLVEMNTGGPEKAETEAETAAAEYTLASVHQVNGRQGVCVEGDHYWVSGSTTLTRYDSSWNVEAENTDPFKGYELEVNHIGDIDVYNNELYLGVEYFMDGVGKNIQVAVYDADTLELKRVFPFREDTGQKECAGIAVDPDSGTVYMVSWIDDESSSYIYMYDLDTGDYKGRLLMDKPPKWLQGIACHDGDLYLTSDDGDADEEEPDHMYRVVMNSDRSSGTVIPERAFDDVTKQGEIEGLSFDEDRGQFLLLYNRGARIVLGMPKGFYEGYTEEIHEVFVYEMN